MIELGQSPDPRDLALIETYETEQMIFEEEALAEESTMQSVSATHLILAVAVTALSVGITLSGMAIIVEQEVLWLVGLVFALIGIVGVTYGVFAHLV
jgi:hypothetical protein